MSKACPHFLAYTFLHWLVAVILTGAGTQVNLIPVENRGIQFLTLIGLFAVVIIQGFLPPGIPKYLLFGTFILLIGQVLRPLEEQLEEKGLLTEVIIMATGVFVSMVALGFYDKFNILPWYWYLFISLIGLLLARLILYGLALTGYYDDKQIRTGSKVISSFAIILFALFTTFDINIIRARAKACRGKPDYVDASMGIFLDYLNLFTSFADILSD
jgi:FtsH-binding integral membrane protein